MYVLLIVAGVLVLLMFYAVAVYNRLVSKRNEVENSWSQIDVQLKRRHDLIPNLIETVKGYVQHERGVLEALTKARAAAMNAKDIKDKIEAENGLMGALSKLIAVAENYPVLKANENFLAMQEELSSTENKIAFARQFYNDTVMGYNTSIQVFPANLIAGLFGFKGATLFEIQAAAEREAPKVNFAN